MDEVHASNQHRLHHLLWECNMTLVPITEEVFEGTELSLALSGTLDEIGTTPGATVSEISRRTPKTQQAISQAAAKLEKLGLVERRLGNGRGVGLYLTPAGERAHRDGNAREQRIEDRLLEILGAEIHGDLISALDRARPKLRDHEATASEATKARES